MSPELHWLPECKEWDAAIKECAETDNNPWQRLVRLANTRIDFIRTNKLDRVARKVFPGGAPADAYSQIRLAVLASSTVDHLLPGLRVGALRRSLWLETYVGMYGQFRQELFDQASPLHRFMPSAVLFALDARHVIGRISPPSAGATASEQLDSVLDELAVLWRRARQAFQCQVLQQTLLPVFPTLLGSNEQRLSASQAHLTRWFNERLRVRADEESVDLIAMDSPIGREGINAWYDPMLWHRAKQEIHPAAGPCYGDLVARVLAAQRGRSYKCLALDLDNTLWGGVIGDDGLDRIVLGQGSALGEAYVEFQQYARALKNRGVILAVCSKNDEAKALEPFDRHPEMVLRRADIACFVANWQDKPANLRQIASRLNIGLDAIAFADDNPFERNIVRRELPVVGVPELPLDPALYSHCIAAGGYFEALNITDDDTHRSEQYRQNLARQAYLSASTDLAGYLESLGMQMLWRSFDRPGMQRIHQLINKTNQFNLTTRRYTEAEVTSLLDDPGALTLQIRLLDQFGDNGMIAIVIARRSEGEPDSLFVETWLMSCRVLGRQVEEATLNLLASQARAAGIRRIVGEYRPTPKNSMVREHYSRLGFEADTSFSDSTGASRWTLTLERFHPAQTPIKIMAAEA